MYTLRFALRHPFHLCNCKTSSRIHPEQFEQVTEQNGSYLFIAVYELTYRMTERYKKPLGVSSTQMNERKSSKDKLC